MPIINQVVSGSGGGSSVSEPYIEYSIVGDKLKSTTNRVVDLSGVKYFDTNAPTLMRTYYDNQNISGTITIPDVEYIRTTSAFAGTLGECKNITGFSCPKLTEVGTSYVFETCFRNCTGLTTVSFPVLEFVSGQGQFSQTFYNTGIVNFTFPKLLYSSGSYVFGSMFQSSTSLVSFSAPVLTVLGGTQSMFYGCTSLTTVSLPKAFWASEVFISTWGQCSALTTLSFPSLTRFKSSNTQQFSNAFGGSGLTSLSFGGLAYNPTNIKNQNFNNMLQGITGCTVHFPAEWETEIQTWASYANGFGGTNTTVLFDLPNVRNVDLSFLTECKAGNMFSQVFSGAENITSVDLSNLEIVAGSYNFSYTFSGCTSLTTVDISSLTDFLATAYNYTTSLCFQYCFQNCTSLTTLTLSSLKAELSFGQRLFAFFIRGTTGVTINVPALSNDIYVPILQDMCAGATNTTVHMPANLSGKSFSLGGTNTTITFDLPSTFILTGADTNEYERNPKYDTATALSWRIKDSSVTTTPYYTSGTADPSVSDAIYSDAACTTSVTTITAIA